METEERERRYLLKSVLDRSLKQFEPIASSLGYFDESVRVRVHRPQTGAPSCFFESKKPAFGLVRMKASVPVDEARALQLLSAANWTLHRQLLLSADRGKLLTLENLSNTAGGAWLMEVEGGDLQLPSGFVGVDVTDELQYYSYSRARASA